jgi:hypothetical protein
MLSTDESYFTQMAIVNTHNIYHRAHENPRCTRDRERQACWSVNEWVDLLGGCIIGPYLLPEHLTAATYYVFIDAAASSPGHQRTHAVPA